MHVASACNDRREPKGRKGVRDPAFWGAPWRIAELLTGHDPMVSEPAALAGILLGTVQST